VKEKRVENQLICVIQCQTFSTSSKRCNFFQKSYETHFKSIELH